MVLAVVVGGRAADDAKEAKPDKPRTTLMTMTKALVISQ